MSSADPVKAAEDMNRTAGAAVALIKKIDVDKYFAERRAMRLGRIRAGEPTRRGPNRAGRQEGESSGLCGRSYLRKFFAERILRLDSDRVRSWSEPAAQTAGEQAGVKTNTEFLRDADA